MSTLSTLSTLSTYYGTVPYGHRMGGMWVSICLGSRDRTGGHWLPQRVGLCLADFCLLVSASLSLTHTLFSLLWILVPDLYPPCACLTQQLAAADEDDGGAGIQGIADPCLGQRWCKDCRVRGRSGASPILFWRHHLDMDTGSTAHRWVQGPMRRGSPWRSGDPEWPRRKPVESKDGPLILRGMPLLLFSNEWTTPARYESIRHLAAH